jgi:hypothetical protein
MSEKLTADERYCCDCIHNEVCRHCPHDGCDFKETLKEVEPVKHGRWIIDYAEGSKIYHAHCSECNKEPDRNIGGDYYIDKLSDFCPNCGCKNGR